jgi:hypothetical protein
MDMRDGDKVTAVEPVMSQEQEDEATGDAPAGAPPSE